MCGCRFLVRSTTQTHTRTHTHARFVAYSSSNSAYDRMCICVDEVYFSTQSHILHVCESTHTRVYTHSHTLTQHQLRKVNEWLTNAKASGSSRCMCMIYIHILCYTQINYVMCVVTISLDLRLCSPLFSLLRMAPTRYHEIYTAHTHTLLIRPAN